MRLLTAICLSFISVSSFSQFKADNVKYKTVYPEDLCKTLQQNKDYVILDVRSDGEYNDTLSMSEGLNIGHIKDAKHIDIRQLPSRWKELSAYKEKPLFIYCSHSQRSRRASRLLADSGFTKVFNINGGLTNFYFQGIESDPCSNYTIVTNVPYKIISAKQMVSAIQKGEPYYMLDLREDSIYNGTGIMEITKVEGHFNDAAHIPYSALNDNLSQIPQNKPILLIDEFGDVSPKAARALIDKGFKKVHILFGGIDGWFDYMAVSSGKPAINWSNNSDYEVLQADKFNDMVKNNRNLSIIDVRSKEEFNNQSKNYWQNIGQIKGAVNIPFSDMINNSTLLPTSKSTPIVVYGFNSDNNIFSAARLLKDQGYEKVYVLQGGIWSLRWASHNLKGKMYLNDLVQNVPPENE
jgi:rhodanese-related sulfurtransferase